MRTERDVVEFIIVPPFAQRAAVAAAKDRLAAYLENRFRGYTFRVGPFAPVGDEEEFCVVPLMNFVGDDGKSYMCTRPNRWLLMDIAEACRSFSHTSRTGCAA
ncbi:hypothetical protein HJA85_27215 [Rhizobium bangladeshense]|uniref:hypothetical protein n=1 Tax=Rhizobium bangladeshense TaxID=1138189 RepID=UPI001C83F893|nr:hypothetical protein [Rhizobium bangladeshense]MBX4870614.1 hypothetical protein [Rhizobium bangladeshense]MBX4872671.1 hypothetical protein [Rhizobium bangladeshense]